MNTNAKVQLVKDLFSLGFSHESGWSYVINTRRNIRIRVVIERRDRAFVNLRVGQGPEASFALPWAESALFVQTLFWGVA
jgi:hypothetical protein